MGTRGVFKAYQKVRVEQSVFEAARERVGHIFDHYYPVLWFSGGKDSTCALDVCRQEALRRGLTLEVCMFDEEILDPDTVRYCEHVRRLPGVRFHWLCLPIRHTLRSDECGHWFTWDPAKKAVWARAMPDWAITMADLPQWDPEKFHFDQYTQLAFEPGPAKKVCQIAAIRAQESLNRERGIRAAGSYLNARGKHMFYAKPIYDWQVEDVWLYIRDHKLEYTKLYDKMYRLGRSLGKQRLGPWGNVAAAAETYQWAQFYPDTWDAAIRRLPQLKSMSRYGNTKLFKKGTDKPLGYTWQEWTFACVEALKDPADRAYWINEIKHVLGRWADKHSIPFPEVQARVDGDARDPHCWKKLAQMVSKNDRIQGGSRDRL